VTPPADARPFTDQAWTAIAGWRDAVETMPFIRTLADGSLPPDAFGFYLAQDAAYLVEFSRTLSAASLLAPDAEARSFYASSAQRALEVETLLHHEWLAGQGLAAEVEPSPVTSAYTNHLLASCVSGSYPVVAAAVLPCFWLYAHIGDTILRRAGDLAGHPYQRWIATYADPGFQETTRSARRLTDDAAGTAGPGTRSRMLAAFERSAMHEYLFFDQGITRPGWPTPPPAHPR
jgi:hydroxymethylpyrimidine/phosphomethylpyrimidine kinase